MDYIEKNRRDELEDALERYKSKLSSIDKQIEDFSLPGEILDKDRMFHLRNFLDLSKSLKLKIRSTESDLINENKIDHVLTWVRNYINVSHDGKAAEVIYKEIQKFSGVIGIIELIDRVRYIDLCVMEMREARAKINAYLSMLKEGDFTKEEEEKIETDKHIQENLLMQLIDNLLLSRKTLLHEG